MWDSVVVKMLVENTFVTLYMTLVSTIFAYLLGLPMGIILVVTAKDGLRPNKVIYKILDIIVNIVRSVPFLILLILVIRRPLFHWCWQRLPLLRVWLSPLFWK